MLLYFVLVFCFSLLLLIIIIILLEQVFVVFGIVIIRRWPSHYRIISIYFCLCLLNISVTVTSCFIVG